MSLNIEWESQVGHGASHISRVSCEKFHEVSVAEFITVSTMSHTHRRSA
jgi:hypothetical protein